MKKRLYLYTSLFLLAGIGFVGVKYYEAYTHLPDLENIWKSDRDFPKQLDIHSYLAGNIARQKGQSDLALNAYLKVLEKDPQNQDIVQDAYLLAMIQGSPDKILPYLDSFIPQSTPAMMADYLKTIQLFQQGKTQQALDQLKNKKKHKIDALLTPLIQSWIYVKQGHRPEALKVLNQLDKTPQFVFAKGYQTFLLGAYYNDKELIASGIQQIQEKRLPAVGFFPLIKKHISKDSDVLTQYDKMVKNYPVTADFIQQMGQENLTLDSGLAEVFYFVSADEGNSLLTKEEALFINSIALLLDSQKTLSLIWGAELTQTLNLNKVALSYYDRLPQKNATLLFKQAYLLTLVNQSDQAMEILKGLEKNNRENIPLLTLMAQIYTEKHQEKEALKIYDFILNHHAQKLETKNLAKTHLMRANINYTLGNTQDLILDLEKAHILLPEDAMIQNDLGYNRLLQGQIDEGFELVQQAYKKEPTSPYILDSLAFAYIQKNQFQVALPLAEKALELMPQSALINMRLGDIYSALGRQREARFQYKKALDLKTDLTPEQHKILQEKLTKH